MSDYSYTNGDGLTKLDVSTPVGAAEPISVLDDAIRQIKAYLKDSTSGLAALISRVAAQDTTISNIATLVGNYGSRNFFSAYSNAHQTISSPNTETKLIFGLEFADPDSVYNVSNSRFVASATGWYRFVLSTRVDWLSPSTPFGLTYSISLRKNGTVVAAQEFELGTNYVGTTNALPRTISLSAGDYVEAYASYGIISGSVVMQISADYNKTCFQGIREI